MRGQFEFPFLRPGEPDREHEPEEEPPLPEDEAVALPLDPPERPSAEDEAELTQMEHGAEATHVPKNNRAARDRGFAALQQIRDRLNDQPRTTFPGTDPIDDAFDGSRGEHNPDGKPPETRKT